MRKQASLRDCAKVTESIISTPFACEKMAPRLIWEQLSISPVRNSAGKVIGAAKIARDVTARKRVERELHESEQRFRTLADALDTQVQFRTQELRRRNTEILQQSDQLRDLSGRLMRACVTRNVGALPVNCTTALARIWLHWG